MVPKSIMKKNLKKIVLLSDWYLLEKGCTLNVLDVYIGTFQILFL